MWNFPLTIPELLYPTQLLRHSDVSRQVTFSPPWNLTPQPRQRTVNNYTYTSASTEIRGFSPQEIVVPCLEYIFCYKQTLCPVLVLARLNKPTYTLASFILLRSFRLGLSTDPL